MNEKLNAIMSYLLAGSENDRRNARGELEKLAAAEEGGGYDDLDRVIDHALITLGVPTHIKGFGYLHCALNLVIKDPGLTEAVTKELYPDVAKVCKTTPTRVERAIRHAIEVAFDRGDLDVFFRVFGNTLSARKGKPTNSEFISMLAHHLRNGENI